MINLEVTALSAAPWYHDRTDGPYGLVGLYQNGDTPYNGDVQRGSFLLSPFDAPETTKYEERIGILTPKSGSTGKLRDKGVTHLRADADITMSAEHFQLSISQSGIRYSMYNFPNGYYAAMRIVNWGQSTSMSFAVPAYTWLAGSYTYYVGVGSGTTTMTFSGDRLLVCTEIVQPSCIRGDGYVLAAAGRRTAEVRKYYRSGSLIRKIGSYGYPNGAPSLSEQSTLLSTIPVTGGSSLPVANLVRVTTGDPADWFSDIIDAAKTKLGRVDLELEEHPCEFGDLSVQCAEQLKYVHQNVLLLVLDVNSWTHFHMLWKNLVNERGWQQAVRAFQKQQRHIGKTKANLASIFKPSANTFLFGKYAVLPAVSDCKRLFQGIERSSLYLKKQRLHSRKVTPIDSPGFLYGLHTAVLTVQCAEYPTWFTGWVQRLIAEYKKWGVWPETVNLLDLIPYSFCVDWFVQFGNMFKEIDTYLNVENYFPVEYCVLSEKWEKGMSITSLIPGIPASGVVTFSYYVRWISRKVPLPNVSLKAVPTPQHHVVESTALILQRL